MARQKRDQASIDNILRLVDALSPEEQDLLFGEMKLIWLRRAIDIGLEESERGETVSEEEMRALLSANREEWISEKGKKK